MAPSPSELSEHAWVLQIWVDAMRGVCEAHNVQWQSFITSFSSNWFEAHRIEVKLLELADREGVAHTDVIKPQGRLYKEARQGAFIRALNLGCGIGVLTQAERDSIIKSCAALPLGAASLFVRM